VQACNNVVNALVLCNNPYLSLQFAVGWASCGQPQFEHESVKPLLSLPLLNV